jgi:hypothetical protein
VYAILKYKQRFEAVRAFTLESGQQEIECQNEKRKASSSSDAPDSPTLSQSEEDLHTPSGARSPLTRIPEENSPFAIGDDDSDEEREETTASQTPSAHTSRRASMASTIDENGSQHARGMSEKARGKKPAGKPPFSRQNSMTSQVSISALFSASASGFTPTVYWVSAFGQNAPL